MTPPLLVTLATGVLALLAAYVRRLSTQERLPPWARYIRDAIIFRIARTFYREMTYRFTLRQYARLRLQDERLGQLLAPGKEATILKVDDAYIPLYLDRSGEQILNEEILTIGPRILISGDPGSGKSSLLRYILRLECRRALEGKLGHFLPILIELRDFVPPAPTSDGFDFGQWALDELFRGFAQWGVYMPADCIDAQIKSGRLILMFDGLDEVGFEHHADVVAAITGLSLRLRRLNASNRILVTMRTQFAQHLGREIRDEYPVSCHLQPFSPAQIYRFLVRWPFKSKQPATDIARIYEHLTTHPTLYECCTNPLVLSMYVALDQRTDAFELPETRTGFFQEVCTELLERRRARQHRGLTARIALRREREGILGRIALAHLTEPAHVLNSIPWSLVVQVVRDARAACTEEDAGEYFDDLAIETGLVLEDRPRQTVRFIHLLFCEFLAALQAAQGQRHGIDLLVNTHREFETSSQLRSRLVETLPFTCAQLPRMDQELGLEKVRSLDDPALAVKCFVEAQAYELVGWSEVQGDLAGRLLGSDVDDWDAQWLDALALFERSARESQGALSRIQPARNDTVMDVGAFFDELVGDDQLRAAALFRKYFIRSPRAAFPLAERLGIDLVEEAAEVVIGHCSDPGFLSFAITQAAGTDRRALAWQVVLAEAGLRHGLIAQRLADIPASEVLVGPPGKKRRFEWGSVGPAKGTAYGVYLTSAMASAPAVDQRWFREVTRLARVPVPYFRYRFRYVMGPAVFFAMSLPAAAYLSVTGLVSRYGVSSLGLFGSALAVSGILPVIGTFLRRLADEPYGLVAPSPASVEGLFRAVLNLNLDRNVVFPSFTGVVFPCMKREVDSIVNTGVSSISCLAEVPVPSHRAFRMFTAEMGDWYTPEVVVLSHRGGAAVNVELGLRLGGVWREWDENGERSKGEIVAWEPGRRLTIRYRSVDLPSKPLTHVDVRFEPVDAERTTVTLTHRGFDELPGIYTGYIALGAWEDFMSAFQNYAVLSVAYDATRGTTAAK